MSGNDDVTVVIPCLEYGEFLGEAVESALAQDGGRPRVIVVDDGSTDERDVARPSSELPGRGGAAAPGERRRGDGAKRRGRAPRRRRCSSCSTPTTACGRARSRRCARRSRRSPRSASPTGTPSSSAPGRAGSPFPTTTPTGLLYRSIVTATSLMRREVFEAVGGFDAALPGYEDWDLYLGALEQGRRGRRVPRGRVRLPPPRELAALPRTGATTGTATARSAPSTPRSTRAPASWPRDSALGPAGRLVYRTWWAWRPLPGSVEQALYRVLFRFAARLRASSTSSAKRRAISG